MTHVTNCSQSNETLENEWVELETLLKIICLVLFKAIVVARACDENISFQLGIQALNPSLLHTTSGCGLNRE